MRSLQRKRGREGRSMTMTRDPYAYAIVASLIASRALAQEPCSSDTSITGFSTIASLNEAMVTELGQIGAGATPQDPYEFILCPDTVFDASSEPLRPILNGEIRCGDDGSLSNSCTFRGGSEQILILDSTVPSYPLEQITFSGITFDEFTANAQSTGTSINALAQSPTTATFQGVSWKTFVTNNIIRQVLDEDEVPMTVNVQNSFVLDGTSDRAVFANNGGQLSVASLTVQDVTAESFISTVNSGSTTFSNSLITQSSIQRVTQTSARGSQTVDGVNINNMVALATVFLAQEAGTSLDISDTVVEQNSLADLWRGVDVQTGAVARVSGDSTFASNSNLQFGIIVSGQASVVTVQDSFFTNNVGPLPTTSTPLFSLQFGDMIVERTELTNNTEYAGQALTFFQGSMSISQSCFRDGNSTFVVFVDSSSTITQSENFLNNTESENCQAPGNRLFDEIPGSNCFTGGTTCEGICRVLADQDQCRAPQPTDAPSSSPSSPTNSPTLFPTQAPTKSDPPSRVPTLTPPTRAPSIPPTITSPPQATGKPTCPGGGFPPGKGKPHKMKLGPRSHLRPGKMMMKPIPSDALYLQQLVNGVYAKEKGSEGKKSRTLPPQYDPNYKHDYDDDYHKATCAPTFAPNASKGMSTKSSKKTKRSKKSNGKASVKSSKNSRRRDVANSSETESDRNR